jgi:hypothetical protein
VNGPPSNLDWLFWLLGGMFALCGIALAAWALFWDRARRRGTRLRRCPRCWYDMTGVPEFQCPECGHTASGEHAVHRTRRRYRLAALGVLTVCLAYILASIPEAQRGGWWGLAPRFVLILCLPRLEAAAPVTWQAPPKRGLAAEFERRIFRGAWELRPLWWPERALLSVRSRGVLAGRSGEHTAATAARAFVLLHADAVERCPEAGRARVVVARCALTYARVASYRDRGEHRGSIGPHPQQPFVTAFDRASGNMRFEFKSRHPIQGSPWMRYVVWRRSGVVKRWWSIQPQTQTQVSLAMGLAGATGVSGGAAHTVPRLLIPDEVQGWSITDLAAPALIEDAEIDGRRCLRLQGGRFIGAGTYWIDAETFCIRRIEQGAPFASVTDYTPEFGVAIDDSWFDFDPARPEESPLP